MQSRSEVQNAVHVTSNEWRWAAFVGLGLVLLASVPLLVVLLTGAPGSGWHFMGFLHNPNDAAAYLSRVQQGANGAWLVRFYHTSELHDGAAIGVIYPLLGHLSRYIPGVNSVSVYHIARIVAALFMYLAIYQLGASIWMRVRTRRIFFVLASVSAGFGFLLLPFTGNTNYPDLTIPEAFPFYSMLVNVHFPLAIACTALLISTLIEVLRPGMDENPNIENGGLSVILLSLAVALLYPQMLMPIGAGLGLFILFYWYRCRRVTMRELRWLSMIFLPALPVAVYYIAVIRYNDVMAAWNSQNVTLAPSVPVFLAGFGLPLLMALPGIIRAIRRFEPDGDQFMLLWLISILVLVYLPTDVQRRFAAGMMLPIAYFATRSLEDFWFERIGRRWRYRAFAVVLIVSMITPLFILFVPMIPVVTGTFKNTPGLVLEEDYVEVYQWLDEHTDEQNVVMASPSVSLWIPGRAGTRAVYGHPYETVNAETKEDFLLDWYGGEITGEACIDSLNQYRVSFVVYGEEEEAIEGESACIDQLEPMTTIGDVEIYAP